MEHIKVFNSMEEYEAAKPSLKDPFVVLEKSTGEVIYSNLVEITEDDITDGQYIDLGLPSGTKWASCNLGATSPCEYGDFYAWGETEPKEVYDWLTYKYGSDWDALTKYNTDPDYGTVDNKTVLEPEDDAVYVTTDGNAHMPTVAQIDELLDETTNQWCQCTVLGDDHTEHNVIGSLFTGSNGNSIFIPAAGYKDGSNLMDSGYYFDVWSVSLNEDDANTAWVFFSDSDSAGKDNVARHYGYSVRGVQN